MKKIAILIDGGFVYKKLEDKTGKPPIAKDIINLAEKCKEKDEEIFRIYYYDCPPFEGIKPSPVSGADYNFSAHSPCNPRKSLQDNLAACDFVAFRRGTLNFKGWRIKKSVIDELIKKPRLLNDNDFQPDITQKTIDIKIGLDVAWLASKQIVDRIVLLTADTDFIPTMKFARREGVQVVVVCLNNHPLHIDFKKHSDKYKHINYP